MCNTAVESDRAGRQQQTKNQSALPAGSESIRHMVIESGFEREASWIVGTKKRKAQRSAGLLLSARVYLVSLPGVAVNSFGLAIGLTARAARLGALAAAP